LGTRYLRGINWNLAWTASELARSEDAVPKSQHTGILQLPRTIRLGDFGRQHQQLDRQNQELSLRFGGVVVHSPSGTETPALANTSRTTRTPSVSGNPSQGIHGVRKIVCGNPGEVQYRLQNYLMDYSEFERPPPVSRTLQQTQSAGLLASSNDPFSASDDHYLDDDFDPKFWNSLLNDPAFAI